MNDFQQWPDLAVRSLGGAVVSANDESFASREHLISPGPSVFDPSEFGPKGKVYDGWETRRRREPGNDEAVVRLGAPGIVHGVVIDTTWFTGNYPPEAAVDGAGPDLAWEPLLERVPLKGDTANTFEVESTRRVTHVRLRIFPDGGVARLRVHGEALPDPALLAALGTVDLAALELGGRVTGCSNLFYSSPNNLLVPGPARSMGEGWETARRRDDDNDWVQVALGTEGTIALSELDTSWFLHNAPGWASLRGRVAGGEWFPLLERTALEPDTRHRFVLTGAPAADEVRLDIFPDGGMARLRLFGTPTATGRENLAARWARAHS
ncbi:allantoicase [Pseudonocardia sp. TRM90224]|uniref:allantoicase n=1 Tax=Pseudonocardia sp. TRM90224 TaxID=2812678 RepID=UPI001E38FCC0|nr:allantoicase [Pseudonocardia sp. TRM90224]